jgi:hypothetical protein
VGLGDEVRGLQDYRKGQQVTEVKKRYLISVYYSDWIEAESENDAINQMSDQLPYLKSHEWEIVCGEEDGVPQ